LSTLGWLRDTYRVWASELAFEYFLLAARRGTRRRRRRAFNCRPDLSGGDLGSATAPLVLAGMNLSGSRLWNSRWRHCNLEAAVFDAADALRASGSILIWPHQAGGAQRWRQRYSGIARWGASFEDALCQRTQWLRCGLSGARQLPSAPEALYGLCTGIPAQDESDPTPRIGGDRAPSCSEWLRVVSGWATHRFGV